MKQIGSVNAPYPTPTTLVGANVNGKPNFITIAHIGILTIDFDMNTKKYWALGRELGNCWSVGKQLKKK